MTCEECRDRFSALVDAELGTETRAVLDAHLAGCAACREELGRFRRTVAALEGLGPERAPLGFVDRVLDAAHPTSRPRRLVVRLFRPLRVMLPLQAAAVLLAAGLALYVYQRSPELQQAARQEAPSPAAPRGRSQEGAPAPPQDVPRSAPVVPAREHSLDKSDAGPAQGALERKDAERDAVPAQTRRETKPAVPSPATPDVSSPARAAPAALPAVAPSVSAPVAPPASSPVASPASPPAASAVGRASDALAPPTRRESATADSTQPTTPAPPGPMTKERQEKAAAQESRVAAASAGLTARLQVTDLAATERALAELLARGEAAEISRRSEGGEILLELAVPGERWPTLRESLARLGRLDLDREPAPIPARLTLRLRISG